MRVLARCMCWHAAAVLCVAPVAAWSFFLHKRWGQGGVRGSRACPSGQAWAGSSCPALAPAHLRMPLLTRMQWRTTQPFSPPSPSCCSLSRCVWSCSSPMQYRRIWRPHRRQISERPQLLGLLRAHVAQVGLSGCACLAASVCAQSGCIFRPVGSHQQWASHLKAPSSTGPTPHLTVCASGCWGPLTSWLNPGLLGRGGPAASPVSLVWVPAPSTWPSMDWSRPHPPVTPHPIPHEPPLNLAHLSPSQPHTFPSPLTMTASWSSHTSFTVPPLLPLQAHLCHPPSPSLPNTPLKACMRCAVCYMRKMVGGCELLRLFYLVPPQARGPPAAC